MEEGMTDLEAFVALYRRFGIECVVNGADDGYLIILATSEWPWKTMSIKPTCSDKFGGYADFYSDVQFDRDGKLVQQGFWE